jgi:hypothetical protein
MLHAGQGKDPDHKEFRRIANFPRMLLTFSLKGREEKDFYQNRKQPTVDGLSNFSKAIRSWACSIVTATAY